MAILASLLSPSLKKTMNAARELTCKNNLKVMGVALSYITDSGPPGRTSSSGDGDNTSFSWKMEGRLPYVRAADPNGEYHYWYSVLGKEMGLFEDSAVGGRQRKPEPMSIKKDPGFRCPSADEQITWESRHFSYGYNMYLGLDGYRHTQPRIYAKLLNEIKNPNKLVTIADMEEHPGKIKGVDVLFGNSMIWPAGRPKDGEEARWHTTTQVGVRHDLGANYVFLDGHVEHILLETINFAVPTYFSDGNEINWR
jgi:prepilin-type processing-associated H-X9-DG protein